MSWVTTNTGGRYDILEPERYTYHLDGIVQALAKVCRWNGHTCRFYSVLEHSLLVYLETKHRLEHSYPEIHGQQKQRILLQSLMHDSAEAFVGDIPTPQKNLLEVRYGNTERTSPFGDYEHRTLNAIGNELFWMPNFGDLHASVKLADNAVLGVEAKVLMGFDTIAQWGRACEPVLGPDVKVGKHIPTHLFFPLTRFIRLVRYHRAQSMIATPQPRST